MYSRKLNKQGRLTPYQANKELIALESLQHHYAITKDRFKGSHYNNQVISLTKCLLDINYHKRTKLLAEYLTEYPTAFID